MTSSLLNAIAADAAALIDLGVEPTSAVKQAAADHGVAYGAPMAAVVAALLS
jgi:hypothetical protein